MKWERALEADLSQSVGRQPTLDLASQSERDKIYSALQKLEQRLGQFVHFLHADAIPTAVPSLSLLKGEDRVNQLFAIGNLDLLNVPTVGICGSRKASEKALRIAERTVGLLASEGVIIASGYAAGVDQVAHKAALEVGGATVIVLPEGISRFSIRRELKDLWDWSRILVVSQFQASAPWRSWNAMKRNRTIMAISKAMLVVEARATGGTLDAGFVSLRYGRPVFAVDFSSFDEASDGNRLLLNAGAIPLKRNRATGEPSIAPIMFEASR